MTPSRTEPGDANVNDTTGYLSLHPSVRLSVTLVIHAQTVQHIKMPFAPHDRAMPNGRADLFAVAEFLVIHSEP